MEASLQGMVPRIGKHPTRVMWGSDRNEPWMFEPLASDLIMEISRLVIARLPDGLSEPYAYVNAQRVLGPYLVW